MAEELIDKKHTQEEMVLQLKVLDGEKIIFQGEVSSISSINEKGEFDVLERHANFITLIQDKLVVRPVGKDEVNVPLKQGIMKVNEDKVTIFVGMNVLLNKKEQKVRDEKETEKSKVSDQK